VDAKAAQEEVEAQKAKQGEEPMDPLMAEAERVEKEAAGKLGSETTDENGTPLPSTNKMKEMLGKALTDLAHPDDHEDALDASIQESVRLLNTYKDLTKHIHKQLDAYAAASADLDGSVQQIKDPQAFTDKAKSIDAEVAGIMGEPIPHDEFELDKLPPLPDMGGESHVTMVTRSDMENTVPVQETPAPESEDSHAGEFTVHVHYTNDKINKAPAAETSAKVEADAVDKLSSGSSIMSTTETPVEEQASASTVTPAIDASAATTSSSTTSTTTTTTTTKTHKPIIAPRELLHV